MATEKELREKWQQEHPFSSTGMEPDFAKQAAASQPAAPAPAATGAPLQPPANAKQLEHEWENLHPFTSSNEKPDFKKIADDALQRYEAQQSQQRAAMENHRAPKPGDYNPEIEQLWAAIRKLQGDGDGGGGGGGVIPPFWLEKVDASNVRVRFGQVNSITPTGVTTNIDVSGTDGTWKIYLHVTLNADGNVTAAEVISGTSAVPSDDSDDAYKLIGEVTVSGGAISGDPRPSLAWSQSFVICGRDPDDPESTPGTYYWELA